MTSDPWAADTPALLTATMGHIMAARLIVGAETIVLDVQDWRLGWDETRAPRVICTIDARVPTDPALLARIDPRTGARLEVDLGYTRPGGVQDVHTVANLGLRGRPVARPDDVMRLVGHSDEALVIDNADCDGAAFSAATTSAAIVAALALAVPGAGITPVVTTSTGPAVTQGPYEDRWDLVQDLADRLGGKLFDDGLRVWHLDPAPVLAAPDLDLAVGTSGTIVESNADLSRDDFYNQVLLFYRWRDTSDVEHTIKSVRRIQTGIYAASGGNTKTLRVEREIATTQTEANAAAAALVARTVTRGRALTVTAISAYWLRPGATVNVTLPTGPTEQHLVVSVEFTSNGLMTVVTRLPDNTGTIGA